jgi:hypothetical protein
MPVLTFFPETRLSELVERFGGITRGDAVEAAMKELESMRGEGDATIERSIAALEALGQLAQTQRAYTPEQMQEILCIGDQIVTLAGTFNYKMLDVASKSLCDITYGLLNEGRNDLASIRVHVQAMRMMAPRSPALAPEDIEKVLSELSKIITFYGYTKAADSVTVCGPTEPPAASTAAES